MASFNRKVLYGFENLRTIITTIAGEVSNSAIGSAGIPAHTHDIDDVNGLQDELDGKSPEGHKHDDLYALLSHGSHVTTSTCVTSIKLGSPSATAQKGDLVITPSSIGAQAAGSYALSSHGTHVALDTCVTSINGQKGDVTLNIGSTSSGVTGIKLGSSTTASTGVVTITPSNIGAATASHGIHVASDTCVTSFNGLTGAVTFSSMIPNGNVSWKTSTDLSYNNTSKCMYFTTSSDCFVIIFSNLNKNRQIFITVDNVVVTVFYEGGNGGGANCCIPVKANKTVRIYYNEDLRSNLLTPVYNSSSATPFSSQWCVGVMT